jgi:hypothetical protein
VTLPRPKRASYVSQPVWELRLNPDYGTLPGVPLLEALHGVGIVGADVPIYTDRPVKLNIYVCTFFLVLAIWSTLLNHFLRFALFQWPQSGQIDYEEWFESPDIASAPLGRVVCIVAGLYRNFFEVRAFPSSEPGFLYCLSDLILSRLATITQRVGPKIKAVSEEWQIRPRDSATGIYFGQLRLTRLYSYDGTQIYPEIVALKGADRLPRPPKP